MSLYCSTHLSVCDKAPQTQSSHLSHHTTHTLDPYPIPIAKLDSPRLAWPNGHPNFIAAQPHGRPSGCKGVTHALGQVRNTMQHFFRTYIRGSRIEGRMVYIGWAARLIYSRALRKCFFLLGPSELYWLGGAANASI
jgi:hypothetical protein